MKGNELVWAALLGALALVPAATTLADTHPHEHDATPRLSLDHGRQWATDAPLRQGMTRIRGIVEPQLGQVLAGSLDGAAYARMASDIEAQLAYIVGNCKLAPDADAVLHAIIAQIGEGIAAMQADGGTHGQQGVANVVVALNDYGEYFAHPGWQPVRGEH
ncbi:MAG: hypothetical protein ACM3IK_01745 [Sphingomonadaceae bacterium]